MSQDAVTDGVAHATGATASNVFALEYEKRLTTAAEAMSHEPSNSALALGLSPCQPPLP